MCVLLGVSLWPGEFWLEGLWLSLALVLPFYRTRLTRCNSPVEGNTAFVRGGVRDGAEAIRAVWGPEGGGGVEVGMS